MIVSHRYRYVFVQVPRTASSSMGVELCDNYAGEPVLHKHATYDEFLKHASREEKAYFVFAGTRNPLDSMVTEYFRRKAGERTEENKLHLEKAIFISDNEASFQEFVRKYHYHFHKPEYSLNRRVDFIYKYENLEEGFSRILEKLNIEKKRPLPQSNRTPGKSGSYLSYYTRDIQPMIRIVFRKRMKKAGYDFPEDWQSSSFKTPFLYFIALLKTAVFAIKLRRLRQSGSVKPGGHDSYTRRLRETYLEDRQSGDDSSSAAGTE